MKDGSEPSKKRSGRVALRMICWFVTAWSLLPALSAQTLAPSPGTVFLSSKESSRMLVDEVVPSYPPLAKMNYIQGKVRLELRVSAEGEVTGAHVIKGHPFLAMAALEAVHGWKYSPAREERAVSGFITVVEMKFNLRQRVADRLPPEPESYLDRQVRPPELLTGPPSTAGLGSRRQSLQLRVLVNVKGQAVDSERVSGPVDLLGAAQREIDHWMFKPARWGNHPVPWYVDVDVSVPAGTDPASPLIGAPGGGASHEGTSGINSAHRPSGPETPASPGPG